MNEYPCNDDDPPECFFCQCELEPAPTTDPWVYFNGRGMHKRCIRRLSEIADAMDKPEAVWPPA